MGFSWSSSVSKNQPKKHRSHTTTQPNVADSDGFDGPPSISNEAPFKRQVFISLGHVSFSSKDGSKERSLRDDFEIKNTDIFISENTPTH